MESIEEKDEFFSWDRKAREDFVLRRESGSKFQIVGADLLEIVYYFLVIY